MKWAYLWGLSMLTCQNRDVFISGGYFDFYAALFSYYTIFMLLFVQHVAIRLFSCYTLPCTLFVRTFFVLHSFHIALSSYSTIFMLHFFSFTFFSCCTLCMLHFFPTVLFSLFLLDHNIDLRKHLEVKMFSKIITFSIIKSSRPGDVL